MAAGGDLGKKSLEEAIEMMTAATASFVEVHEVELQQHGSAGEGGGVGVAAAAAKTVVVEAAAVEGAAPSEGEILGGAANALDEQYRKLWRANGEKA